MGFDAFMKIGTIPGESTDDKHPEWIEVMSFQWGVSQAAGAAGVSALGGQTGGRADFTDFSVVKLTDKASAKLFLACCAGEHLADVTLEFCKAGGDKEKYLEIKLTDVVVANYRPGGNSQSAELVPLEEVGFRFGTFKLNYTQMDNKTGKSKGNVNAGWDLTKNKKM